MQEFAGHLGGGFLRMHPLVGELGLEVGRHYGGRERRARFGHIGTPEYLGDNRPGNRLTTGCRRPTNDVAVQCLGIQHFP